MNSANYLDCKFNFQATCKLEYACAKTAEIEICQFQHTFKAMRCNFTSNVKIIYNCWKAKRRLICLVNLKQTCTTGRVISQIRMQSVTKKRIPQALPTSVSGNAIYIHSLRAQHFNPENKITPSGYTIFYVWYSGWYLVWWYQ